jgi:hypothetical protein
VRTLKVRKMVEYASRSCMKPITRAAGSTSQAGLMCPPLSSPPAAATAPRSAPMLTVLAAKTAAMQTPTSQLGNFRRSAVPRPTPVCKAMRAHVSWTATISGKVKRASQRVLVPNWLPAWE